MDELIAAAELGEEAKRFLESDLGRCLIGMAQQEVQIAQESLGEVNPTDSESITKLQNHIKLFKTFEQWLHELLGRGEEAIQAFKQERT